MSMTRKISRVFTLFICVSVMLFSLNGKVYAAAPPNYPTVENSTQLLKQIERARHGDTIGITGEINFYEGCTLGAESKMINLIRMNDSAKLYFSGSGSYTIQNITFDGNKLSANNPFLYSTKALSIKNCVFQNCICNQGDGGAVCFYDDALSILNCTFKNNSSSRGGHLFASGVTKLEIKNSAFINGSAEKEGGAICIQGGNFTINDSTITANKAGTYGGGVYSSGMGVLSKTKLYGNQAVQIGADYATETPSFNFAESVKELEALYADEGLKPIRWDVKNEGGVHGGALVVEDISTEKPEPSDPSEPSKPSDPSDPKDPTDPDTPIKPDDSKPDSADPIDPEKPGTPETEANSNTTTNNTDNSVHNTTGDTVTGDTVTDNSYKDGSTHSNTSSNTTSSTSSTDNSTSSINKTVTETYDNSKHSSTTGSNNTSTVNYYTKTEAAPSNQQPEVQTIVVPVEAAGSNKPIEQTIKIESSSPDRSFPAGMGSITLNINADELLSPDQMKSASETGVQNTGVSWYQAAVLCLLSCILVCLIRKP